MADVLLSPEASSLPNNTSKKRLNWLSWMRKSLTLGTKSSPGNNKSCACGLHHSHEDLQHDSSGQDQDWPVFTTQMSHSAAAHNNRTCTGTPASGGSSNVGSGSSAAAITTSTSNTSNSTSVALSSLSSPPNSPILERSDSRGGRLLPLRPIHLASRCHEEVLYTRLNRSCSINSAASMAANSSLGTTPTISEEKEAVSTLINQEDQHEQEEESRIMVNLEAIEVVSNLDEARLLSDSSDAGVGNHDGVAEEATSTASSSTTSSMSSSSKCLSKFSSPFKRRPKGLRKSKEETFERLLLSTSEDEAVVFSTTTAAANGSSSDRTSTAISRDELLKLFILKLDEEANYFQVSASPEEELCDCQKCQIYYCEYYEKYLEEYERRRAMLTYKEHSSGNEEAAATASNLEASILMDDIMNNGMTFCSIM